MKRRYGMILATVVIALLLTQCYNSITNPVRTVDGLRPLTKSEQMIASSSQSFGIDVFKDVVREEQGNNVFISPLSLSMALGMALNGAAGDTRSAMMKTIDALDLSVQDMNASYQSLMKLLVRADPKVKMELANSIWYRDTFSAKQSFIKTCQSYYDARVQAMDFNDSQATKIINNWVSDKTHGKIEKMVDPPIPADAMMYLMNAIYFKGDWIFKFDSTATRPENFTLTDGSTVRPDMMRMSEKLPLYQSNELQMLDLAYGDSLFSMDILLPTASTNIDDFVSGLTRDKVDSWINELQVDTLNVIIPKFEMDYEITLNKMLADLGMGIAFSPGQADFSNINSDEELYISKVKQKSYIKVNEEGTEAAAVTIIEMVNTSSTGPAPRHVTLFKADHPFVYLIRERSSGTILFIGKMENPVE